MIEPQTVAPEFNAIAALISRRAGLSFATIRPAFVEAGILRAMKRAGSFGLDSYLIGLHSNDAWFRDLVSELTIGETYFFRDPAQFDFVREQILPAFRSRRYASNSLRAWSAGCASGEEPYSLAILFEEEGLTEHPPILATDLSRVALAKAERGIYGSWSFRGQDPALTHRYFRPSGKNFEILPRFRQRIRLDYLNLAADSDTVAAAGASGLDVIFCRNVLIYFHQDAIARVANTFCGALAEDGWLLTGASDPPLSDFAPLEMVITSQGINYRRKAASGSPMVKVALPRPNSDPDSREAAPSPPERKTEIPGPPLELVAAEPVPVVLEGAELYDFEIRALHRRGDTRGAERVLAAALARYPMSAALFFLQAILLLDLGRAEEAALAARRVVYLDRGLAMGHFALATILERIGECGQAARGYQTAHTLSAALPEGEIISLSDDWAAGEMARVALARSRFILDKTGSDKAKLGQAELA